MVVKRLARTAAVIRTWNNKFIIKAVENLLKMGIGRVIVVCNATPDKGATKGYLEEFLSDDRVQLIEMYEGYSWSNALNRAMMAVQMTNATMRSNCDYDSCFRYIFNVSVEAGFEKKHMTFMLDAMAEDSKVGIVGTSFDGRLNGNKIDLGRSYKHPRNTGMLIKIEAMGALFSGFDSFCDGIGGMEDIDFMLRMLAFSDLKVEHLDMRVPLVVGNNYHQPTKEANEKRAMDQIIARWRAMFKEHTAERARIDAVIAKMGVEA